jgi:hypothetical protein
MVEDRVTKEALTEAALGLMSKTGRPLERIKSRGRAVIFRMPNGKTVRLRTSNDHLLLVGADAEDPRTARLNVEGTDYVLIVMPERQRTPGRVICYLVPAEVVADAVRSSQSDWLATKPNTKGNNRTWTLWFSGPAHANNFAEKWSEYRLLGDAFAGLTPIPPASHLASPQLKLGDVIASARLQIAEAAGVPADRVRITIDV